MFCIYMLYIQVKCVDVHVHGRENSETFCSLLLMAYESTQSMQDKTESNWFGKTKNNKIKKKLALLCESQKSTQINSQNRPR